MRAFKALTLYKKVLIATQGPTFRGILYNVKGDFVVLKNAELLEEDKIIQMDGEVIIDRNNIEFTQVLG